MHICLCVVLAAVPALGIRHISPNNAGDSEANVIYSGNPLSDALTLSQVADNRTTSLLQFKPPEHIANRSMHKIQQAKADIAVAMKQKTVLRSRRVAEREFEAELQAAITGIMAEAKAAAKAAHDQVFHHGYYRAVKAETAAKAAAEAADKAMATASEKAKAVGNEVVFRTLVKHSELGTGATVKQLLDDAENQVKKYLITVESQCHKYPKIVGLEAFLEQMKAMDAHVEARKGKPFDGEEMTKVSLVLVKVMIKSLYFDFKIDHEAKSVKRVLQQDSEIEMSNKMKSEVGLHGFLEHVSTMESFFQGPDGSWPEKEN